MSCITSPRKHHIQNKLKLDTINPTPQVTDYRCTTPLKIPAALSNLRKDDVKLLFDWKNKKVLGKGSFGTVYRVMCIKDCQDAQLRIEAEYALKMLPKKSVSHNNQYLERLAHEIAILQGINHPSCLKLFDAFVDTEGDNIYLVMELVEGGQLLEMLKNHVEEGGCLTELEAAAIIKQLLEVLVYLHGCNIVHRDLKPENVLIDPSTMKIKVIDFGFAKFFGKKANIKGLEGQSSPLLMTPLGSFHYMAPEILWAIGWLGARPRVTNREDVQKLDIFAVGVICYLMLGGEHPFESRSATEAVDLIEDGVDFSAEHFEGISEEAKEFCKSLMKYEAKDRITAEEALRHPWIIKQQTVGRSLITIRSVQSVDGLMEWMRTQDSKNDGKVGNKITNCDDVQTIIAQTNKNKLTLDWGDISDDSWNPDLDDSLTP